MSQQVPESGGDIRAGSSEAGPHTEPDDREEIYFQGSPPVRALAGPASLCFLACVVMVVVGAVLIIKHPRPWWLGPVMILLGLVFGWIPTFLAKSIRYRVSNYRIDFERGLLGRNIDTIELWHVEDLHFHQSLYDRVLNVGNITVLTHDETMPRLELRGVPNPRPLYEMLKQRVIAVKRQRGVIKMDPG